MMIFAVIEMARRAGSLHWTVNLCHVEVVHWRNLLDWRVLPTATLDPMTSFLWERFESKE